MDISYASGVTARRDLGFHVAPHTRSFDVCFGGSRYAAVGGGLAVAGNGLVYIPNSGGHNVFVTKLDPSGNVLYSTYFGEAATPWLWRWPSIPQVAFT